MEIAPGIRIEEWLSLDLSDKKFNENWKKALNIFEKRINERYLEPVKLLVDAEVGIPAKNRKYGFSIMAILCLLVEALQCFIEGKNQSDNTREIFSKYLLENEPFKTLFKDKDKLPGKIYTDVRCGILHQAEITGGTKLWSIGPTATISNGKMILNRNKFYSGMLKSYSHYLDRLKKDDDDGIKLRINFEKKMNHIIKNAA